jgi:hypothetical protein
VGTWQEVFHAPASVKSGNVGVAPLFFQDHTVSKIEHQLYLKRVCPSVIDRRQRCADAQPRWKLGQPLTSRSYANNRKKHMAKAGIRKSTMTNDK